MLLRQAGLWNDELNKTIKKTREIRDISDYWYGYAIKGIDAGILTLKSDNTINPDEYLTRGEFANMAAKILTYNQCIPSGSENIFASAIGIVDSDSMRISRTVFRQDDIFRLIPILTEDVEKFRYEWSAYDSVTGKIIRWTDLELSSKNLGVGSWYIKLSVIDKESGTIVSSPSTTIMISDEKKVDGEIPVGGNGGIKDGVNGINGEIWPSLFIDATPLSSDIGKSITFSSYATGNGSLKYNWDFGDGSRITWTGIVQKHIYTAPWIYTVTVTLTDSNGKTVQSRVIVQITGEKDSDGDGISDIYDACPTIIGTKQSIWCPDLEVNAYTKWTDLLNNWGTSWVGKSEKSLLGDLAKNLCIANKARTQWMIVVSPICDQCPCDNMISFEALARSCDILFPTILSPDFSVVYSRWGFYQLP
jgi:PKD domain/S-layer homology domain